MSTAGSVQWSVRQRWAAVAQGLQQDALLYTALRDLLQQQFHAALRHSATDMEQVALQITGVVQKLDVTRQARSDHVRALLPDGAPLSMRAALAQLQPPLQQQLGQLWAQLEAQVLHCKELNVRNCQLIMEQAELMRTVIVGNVPSDIYAPL